MVTYFNEANLLAHSVISILVKLALFWTKLDNEMFSPVRQEVIRFFEKCTVLLEVY